MDVNGETVRVQASIGVTVSPDGNGTTPDLLKRADLAMYAAKRTDSGYLVQPAHD